MTTAAPQPFLLFGHRGAAAVAPENTLEGFAKALADGANALETDVHATSDGVLVCSHDPDGRRAAGVEARIADSTLAEVRRWDAGWGFSSSDGRRPYAGRGLRVPTLEEVLERFPGVPLSVDLKPHDLPLAEALVELLRRAGAAARVTVGSFHGDVVRRVRRLGYAGPTALTAGEVRFIVALRGPVSLVRRFVRGSAAMIPPRAGPVRLDTTRLVLRLRRMGLRADYWVVNDPDTARTLVRRGATGLVSDVPSLLATEVLPHLGDPETL